MKATTWVDFRPLPILRGPHLQTIVAAKLNLSRVPPSQTKLVELRDGDRIALEISTPTGWRCNDRTVLMLHGLGGCHRSPYSVRLTRKLLEKGIRSVRMNMRGCGSGRGLARQLYHSGRSDDVLAVLDCLKAECPQSPIILVGFSLGGNLALKLAGELSERASHYAEQVIAVCPPVDLVSSSQKISHPSNKYYNRYLVRLLRAQVAYRHRRFPELPHVRLPRNLTLFEFDDIYTAPRCGFRDAMDYYRNSSSAQLLPNIRVACRILFAADDPLIDCSVVERLPLPENILLTWTGHGGHLGFLGIPGRAGGYRWMDSQLLEWTLNPP